MRTMPIVADCIKLGKPGTRDEPRARRQPGTGAPRVADNVVIMAQLLLVEYDAAHRGALIQSLTEGGHAVTSTVSAMTAAEHVHTAPPDLVLLGPGPARPGRIRGAAHATRDQQVPVVVITARDDEAEIIRARWTRGPTTTWSSRSARRDRGPDPAGPAPGRG